jgi:hypothetical protein
MPPTRQRHRSCVFFYRSGKATLPYGSWFRFRRWTGPGVQRCGVAPDATGHATCDKTALRTAHLSGRALQAADGGKGNSDHYCAVNFGYFWRSDASDRLLPSDQDLTFQTDWYSKSTGCNEQYLMQLLSRGKFMVLVIHCSTANFTPPAEDPDHGGKGSTETDQPVCARPPWLARPRRSCHVPNSKGTFRLSIRPACCCI